MAWFAFDIDNYDADTMHLTAAQDGMYGRLLRFYYQTRLPLPDNDLALASIARVTLPEWEASKTTIRAFFKARRGKLVHKRCDAELDKQDRFAKSRSQHATKASHSRSSYINKLRSPRSAPDVPEIKADDLKRSTRPDKREEASDDKESSGGKPPDEPANGHDQTVDPVKALFDAGVSVLTGAGSAEKQARSLVGKWRKAMHDDGKLLAILLSAAEHHAIDPVAWIAKAVAEATQPGLWGNGSRAVI